MPAVRIALQHLLHQQRQPVEAATHVRRSARQPHPRLRWQPDHRPSARSTRPSAASSTPASTRTRTHRQARSRSCRPLATVAPLVPSPSPATASMPLSATALFACRRQRAAGSDAHRGAAPPPSPPRPGAKLSATIRAFSDADQRRRRSGPDKTVTVVMCPANSPINGPHLSRAHLAKAAYTGRVPWGAEERFVSSKSYIRTSKWTGRWGIPRRR